MIKKINIKACFSEKGFSLLEMLFTVFILTVGIIGVYGALVRLISQTSYISSRLIASYLAQEGVEITRNIRDGNWVEGVSWDTGLHGGGVDCSTGCEADCNETLTLTSYGARFLYIDHTDGLYKYIGAPAGDDIKTKFKRKITVTNPLAGVLDVKVEILWENQSFVVQEQIYNWK